MKVDAPNLLVSIQYGFYCLCQSGSGGRKEALKFLNSEPRRFPWFWLKWKKQSLAGLAAQKAYLHGIELQKADLIEANFQKAILGKANLQEAILRRANLQQAYLRKANLRKVNLGKADLTGADLTEANLQEAILDKANLQEAVLVDAENLTPKQIKTACFWEKAIYKGEWNPKKKTGIASEPDNTDFIEELKEDKSSKPEKRIDCKLWEK